VTEHEHPAVPAEPEAKPRRAKKIILSIVSVLVVIGIVAVAKVGLREVIDRVTGNTTKAVAGDCVTDAQSADDMKVVDCTAADAAYKVAGVGEDKTQAEANDVCAQFATAEDYLFLYEGTLSDTTKGRVLCLEKNQK